MHIAAQPQVGVDHPCRFFTAREDGVHHRQIEVANIDVTAQITAPLRVCYLHLSVKLSVVGQTNQPAQLGTVIVQVGGQIQRLKRHGERCIIHALRDLHVTSAQGDLPLWQPLFGGVPTHIGFTGEHAAGLGCLRHKRF
ncbi:hypothetical protein SDC9_188163 [bioreactor metagenome]|uniref:Uncharacterized protein n=1 Tax=bioreactor metagenome TaxID=1076179 RepID=A0A645HNJ3_9ZZZZ